MGFIFCEDSMSSCGADLTANSLVTSLTDSDFPDIPLFDVNDVDLKMPVTLTRHSEMYKDVVKPSIDQLMDQDGIFAKMYAGMAEQLQKEYKASRITGAEYSKAYVNLMTAVLQGSMTFLFQSEQSFWTSQSAQIQAITARVAFEGERAATVQRNIDARTAKVANATAKLGLATADAQYCTAQYNLSSMLPAQLDVLQAQEKLVTEQHEVQRAQTMDTRSDGFTPVSGVLGRQKLLYEEQIAAYEKDSKMKAAKLFTDAWAVMKTMDDALVPPTGFTNASIDTILTSIKTTNGLS